MRSFTRTLRRLGTALFCLAVLAGGSNVPNAAADSAKPLFPEFDLKTLDGRRLSSSELRGKVILLDFWGTWCPPCVSAVPSLRELNRDLKGEPFVLVSVAVEQDDGPVRGFIQKNRMDWPQIWDPTAVFTRQSNVSRFPTYILVSHDGRVLETVVGTSRGIEKNLRDQVVRAIRAAKAAAPTSPTVATR